MDSLDPAPPPPKGLRRITVRGGAITGIAQAIRLLIRFTAQITIARLLLPSDYGLIAMVSPVLAIVTLVADLGMGTAVLQRPNITARELTSAFWVGQAVNVGLAAAIALFSPLVALLYGEPRLMAVTATIAMLIPITGLTTIQFALMGRDVRFASLATLDVLPPLVGLGLGLAAAMAGWAYWSLVAAQASEAAVLLVLAWTLSRWRPGWPAYDRGVWSILKVGGQITGTNISAYLTSSVDNIILGLWGGSAVLGLYDKAYRTVTQPITQLLSPFDRVAVPVLLKLRDHHVRYRAAFLNILQLVQLVAVPGTIGLAIIAHDLFPFLLGPNWTMIGPICSWLCIATLGSPLYSSLTWLFLSQARAGEQMRYSIAVAIVSTAGFVAGLPWGAVGVATGLALSFLCLSIPMSVFGATRRGPVGPGVLMKATIPFLAAGGVTGALLLLLRRQVAIEGLALVVILPAAYLLFAAVLAFLPNGRKILGSALSLRTHLALGGVWPPAKNGGEG